MKALMMQIIEKNDKALIDELLKGLQLEQNGVVCTYIGAGMMRTENGGVIDVNPPMISHIFMGDTPVEDSRTKEPGGEESRGEIHESSLADGENQKSEPAKTAETGTVNQSTTDVELEENPYAPLMPDK